MVMQNPSTDPELVGVSTTVLWSENRVMTAKVAAQGVRVGRSLDLLQNLLDYFPYAHSLEVVSDDEMMLSTQNTMAE
jgi:hypothetical protein